MVQSMTALWSPTTCIPSRYFGSVAIPRRSPGQALIAYHDQYIELIPWTGERMGCGVLSAPSDKAQVTRRASPAD